MAEQKMDEIGHISGFFAHPSVAVMDLKAALKKGDTIYVKGHTTDFQQVIESMQIDRQSVEEAKAGDSVGIKVSERCRNNDVVYKLVG